VLREARVCRQKTGEADKKQCVLSEASGLPARRAEQFYSLVAVVNTKGAAVKLLVQHLCYSYVEEQ
jgi:hypothetical protein